MWKYLGLIPEWFSELFKTSPQTNDPSHAPARKFLVIGHRGSPCSEVENTIPSFQRALDVDGANGLELDLCMTSDGVVVVWHDWDPDDNICRLRNSGLEPAVKYCPFLPDDESLQRPLSALTHAELVANYGYMEKEGEGRRIDARIPTFDELMEWAVGRPSLEILFLDIKVPECELELVPRMMEKIEGTIARHSPGFTIVLETASQSVLDAMKRCSPERNYTLDVVAAVGVVLDPSAFSAMACAVANDTSHATAQRPRQVTAAPWTTYRRIIEHDIELRDADARPRSLIGFTINDEEEMRELIRMGIDGLQTDRPELLVKVLAEERGGVTSTRVRDGAPARAVAQEG